MVWRKEERWLGGDRYELLQQLGEGGFGVVYRAFDHRQGIEVALKTLKQLSGEMLYRFKQEFRALADISHPNLVSLYELVVDEKECFFTMELVEGVDILAYLQTSPEMPSQQEKEAAEEEGVEAEEKREIAEEESAKAEKKAEVEKNTPMTEGSEGGLSVFDISFEMRSAVLVDEADAEASEAALAADKAPKKPLAQAPKKPQPQPLVASPRNKPRFSLPRLLETLPQFAQGIDALHRAGRLHRDLKPSNVLVTPQGRVVILDFGLVSEMRQAQHEQTMPLAGTPAYMSPEQALHQPLFEASDWYSFGVILYQVLCDRLPFDGSIFEIMGQKVSGDPLPPSAFVEGLPAWLETLSLRLLSRNPTERPSYAALLSNIGAQAPAVKERSTAMTEQMPLVGRQRELAFLREALQQTAPHQAVAVFLEGASGIGKTHLARRALALFQSETPALVWQSRCYKQESVPYKAVDGLMDQLSHYLRLLPPSELRAILPDEMHELMTIFPVLRRIKSIPQSHAPHPTDAREQRRRAFEALRELLCRLSQRRKLIFWIDDLQWGDLDSASLLIDLLRPPQAPALLFVGCFRSEDSDSSPFLKKFLSLHQAYDASFSLRRLAIKELPLGAATEIAALMLGKPELATSPLLASLARQAGGNPSFLEELIRYIQHNLSESAFFAMLEEAALPRASAMQEEATPLHRSEASISSTPSERPFQKTRTQEGEAALSQKGREGAEKEGDAEAWQTRIEPLLQNLTLEQVFEERYRRLEEGQQRILDALAIAGQPTSKKLLARIVGVGLSTQAWGILRHRNLIRLRDGEVGEEVDLYHERIRETLLERLDEEQQREFHRRIATELEEEDTPDAKRLARHLIEAKEPIRALYYTLQAAKEAEEMLAFAQAARWYRQALLLEPLAPEQKQAILQGLANALAMQGFGAEAAEAYLQAAEGAMELPQQELRLLAATQLIRSGLVERGIAVLSRLLPSLKLRWSRSGAEALWNWLRFRIRLFFRKLPDSWLMPLEREKVNPLVSLQARVASLQAQRHPSHDPDQPLVSALDPKTSLRLQACRLVAMEVGLVDVTQGMAFQAQHLLEAVKAGDPYRLGLAYALEAAYSSFQGPSKRRQTQQLTDQALTLGKQLHDPHLLGTAHLTAGFAAFTQGFWQRAYDQCHHAESILRQRCMGVVWELSNCHVYQMNALLFLGEFPLINERLFILLREAEERGDLYTQSMLRLGILPRLFLSQDRAAEALESMEKTMQRWSHHKVFLQHYIEFINRGEIALYQEQPEALWTLMQTRLRDLQRSFLLRVQFNRIEVHHLKARCALACAAKLPTAQRASYLKEAERCALVVEREGVRWASPWALHIRAGIAFLREEPAIGLQYLTAAEARLEDVDMRVYTHATMLCRGLWLPHHIGQPLFEQAAAWMQKQQIKAPLRLVQALLPGCLPLAP